MNDHFTETTTRSWFSRIGGAFKGILLGLVLLVIAFPLLWWNEGRAIDRTHTLEAGRQAVVPLTADQVDPARDGQLIHLRALATTTETLSDPTFGLSVKAIKLRRRVEMYQWTETRHTKTNKQLGGSETTETTYDYQRNWSDHWIDSSQFKRPDGHRNPASMPYGSHTEQASDVTLGAFRLGSDFVAQIDDYRDYPVGTRGAVPQGFELDAGGYYRGNPLDAEIGDIRVRFQVVEPTRVSVVGRQQGDRVETARMAKGSIALLDLGTVDAQTMFDEAETSNRILTWGLRAGGIALMWIGLGLILAPLKVLADVVPWIGSLVGAGTGLIAGLIALALGFLTIALAWIFYRPLLAGILLGSAVLALVLGGVRMRTARRVAAPAASG